MRGDKEIGQDGGGAPVYKYQENLSTDGSGVITVNNLEWDNYLISINNVALDLDISESCTPQPKSLLPNTSVATDLILSPHTTNSLLVAVTNESGVLLEGASVRLYRGVYDESQNTTLCGQTFFSGLSEGTVSGGDAYTIDASLTGFENQTVVDVDVSGPSGVTVILNSI
jgi:hypothetical protein